MQMKTNRSLTPSVSTPAVGEIIKNAQPEIAAAAHMRRMHVGGWFDRAMDYEIKPLGKYVPFAINVASVATLPFLFVWSWGFVLIFKTAYTLGFRLTPYWEGGVSLGGMELAGNAFVMVATALIVLGVIVFRLPFVKRMRWVKFITLVLYPIPFAFLTVYQDAISRRNNIIPMNAPAEAWTQTYGLGAGGILGVVSCLTILIVLILVISAGRDILRRI